MRRDVHGVTVHGVDVDPETRCAHYHAGHDVIAICFACCRKYYPCHACHDALADHEPAVWPREKFDSAAVLCGACGTELTITDYRDTADSCPGCGNAFNPGCARHADRYFDVDGDPSEGRP